MLKGLGKEQLFLTCGRGGLDLVLNQNGLDEFLPLAWVLEDPFSCLYLIVALCSPVLAGFTQDFYSGLLLLPLWNVSLHLRQVSSLGGGEELERQLFERGSCGIPALGRQRKGW